MCGRFAVTTDPARLAAQLDAVNETGIETGGADCNPNYNTTHRRIEPTLRFIGPFFSFF